jgi:hypothetical protein
MIKYIPQILMIICIFAYVSIYLIGIKKGKVKPVLASWLVLALATILSGITNFRETGVNGLLANSFNLIDTFAILIIFLVVLLKKETKKQFNKFEKNCLTTVLVIFIIWIISGQNILAHLAIQVILIIAYLPTLIHLWKATENTESLSTWSFDSAASVLGIIEPLRTMAFLPLVYGIRAVISTLTVVVLIIRLKYKTNKN